MYASGMILLQCSHNYAFLLSPHTLITAAFHSVNNVTITRTSDSSVTVSWEGLTFYEARGFPMYMLQLRRGDKSGEGDITVLTPNTSAAVADIDPATLYEVSVTVYTGAGLGYGAESERGVLSCRPWHPTRLLYLKPDLVQQIRAYTTALLHVMNIYIVLYRQELLLILPLFSLEIQSSCRLCLEV